MPRLYGPGPVAPPPLISTRDLSGLSTDDVEGSPVGELAGALSEEGSGLIRYLDVAVRGAQKHVLVPIGHARIDREPVPPRVRLRAATQQDLLNVPAFVKGETPMDSDYHDEVMRVHGQLFYGSRYYAHPAYDHTLLKVGDQAVKGREEPEEAEGGERLKSLSEIEGFRLPTQAPALIDWRVVDEDEEDVGTVIDLLVQDGPRLVRYVVIQLDSPARPTMLPIGYVSVERESRRVRLPTLTVEDVQLLPAFEPPLTRQEENRLHAALEGRLRGDRYFERADFRSTS